MTLGLEMKKAKRTGLLPAFLLGGTLAGALPVLNTALRWELYSGLSDSPIRILLAANGQMMVLFNLLLILVGGCTMYRMEHADKAMERMRCLPIREESVFLGKTFLLTLLFILALSIEGAALWFCAQRWFAAYEGLYTELFKSLGFVLVLALPSVVLSLLIASAFKNMWTCLGLGVICLFLALMIPFQSFLLTLFPYALPFQILPDRTMDYILAAVVETALLFAPEFIFIKIRRVLE